MTIFSKYIRRLENVWKYILILKIWINFKINQLMCRSKTYSWFLYYFCRCNGVSLLIYHWSKSVRLEYGSSSNCISVHKTRTLLCKSVQELTNLFPRLELLVFWPGLLIYSLFSPAISLCRHIERRKRGYNIAGIFPTKPACKFLPIFSQSLGIWWESL